MNNETSQAQRAEKPARQEGIQALRAVAALMVVLFHAGGAVSSPKYQHNELIGTLTYGLDIGVDLFFVISGFVISLPLFSGRTKRPKRFLIDRLSRIYPMAAFTTVLYLFAYHYAGDNPKPLLGVALTSGLLIPSPWEIVPFALWTLKHEVLFYALFSIVYIDKRFGFAILIAWALGSLMFFSDHWLIGWFFFPQHIEFIFGIAASALFCRHRISTRSALSILAVATVVFLIGAFAEEHLNTNLQRQALVCGISGMAVVYCVACIRFPKSIFTFLGDTSFSIYLFHSLFVTAANRIAFRLELPDFVTLLALCLAATVGGVLFYLLVERHVERWRKSKISSLQAGARSPKFPAASALTD